MWHVLALLLSGGPVLSFLGWLVINDVLYLYLGVCSFTKPWRVVRVRVRVRVRGPPSGAARQRSP